MKTYKDILKSFEHENSKEKMQSFSSVLEEMVEDYQKQNPEKYQEYLKRMNDVLYPKKTIDERYSEKLVEKIKKESKHDFLFTKEYIKKIMKENSDLENIDENLFYCTINLIYYVFYDENFSIKSYIKLCLKLINNKYYNEDTIENITDIIENY